MKVPYLPDPYLPPGTTDADPYFELPSDGLKKYVGPPPPPETTMVYCPEGMHHWEAPANEKWWKARVETCSEHSKVEYLNPTGRQSWEWSARDLCAWCGSKTTVQGCFCRYCDSCSAYWKDSIRKDGDDGRPRRQSCPDCVKEGF